jgi:hypothetical protein
VLSRDEAARLIAAARQMAPNSRRRGAGDRGNAAPFLTIRHYKQ